MRELIHNFFVHAITRKKQADCYQRQVTNGNSTLARSVCHVKMLVYNATGIYCWSVKN